MYESFAILGVGDITVKRKFLKSLPLWSLHSKDSSSQLGMILTPRGQITIYGGIFDCHSWGWWGGGATGI